MSKPPMTECSSTVVYPVSHPVRPSLDSVTATIAELGRDLTLARAAGVPGGIAKLRRSLEHADMHVLAGPQRQRLTQQAFASRHRYGRQSLQRLTATSSVIYSAAPGVPTRVGAEESSLGHCRGQGATRARHPNGCQAPRHSHT